MFPLRWEDYLRAGPTRGIHEANRRPIQFFGTIRLRIYIGTLLVQDDFLFCDRLAAVYILGTPFLDRHVMSIQPPER